MRFRVKFKRICGMSPCVLPGHYGDQIQLNWDYSSLICRQDPINHTFTWHYCIITLDVMTGLYLLLWWCFLKQMHETQMQMNCIIHCAQNIILKYGIDVTNQIISFANIYNRSSNFRQWQLWTCQQPWYNISVEIRLYMASVMNFKPMYFVSDSLCDICNQNPLISITEPMKWVLFIIV